MPSSTTTVMWFRRDLRLADNPALLEACADGPVLPLFVLDPSLWRPAGAPRRAYLCSSLRDLSERVPLSVVTGDPVDRVVAAAREVGAERVHVAADFGPYGRRRDDAVEQALNEAGVELVRTGSPYAVAPGRVTSGSGEPYRVFTPWSRGWAEEGWRDPVDPPAAPEWVEGLSGTATIPAPGPGTHASLPPAGEAAATSRWRAFLEQVDGYAEDRDKPGVDGTSRMSVHLRWGEIHPRTMLADLASSSTPGAAAYRTELGWREFYADVLAAQPHTARDYLRPDLARMRYADPRSTDSHFDAWREGRTGYPVVDAGMRQMRATGWMHNRVRMITASFLVKDLHIEWQHGARHFMLGLVDGDLASNQHGWQWVAGSGTDPAPYFRVFNPTTQGRKFDPDAAYVRRWVPELAEVGDPHDPSPADRDRVGYPQPVVDHGEERQEALHRWEEIRR